MSAHLQTAFAEQTFNLFPKICNSFLVSKTKFLQCLDMHFIFI